MIYPFKNEKKKMIMVAFNCIQTGQQARFDLQGALMGYHADLPTHLGLHHHGDEPEVSPSLFACKHFSHRRGFRFSLLIHCTTLARCEMWFHTGWSISHLVFRRSDVVTAGCQLATV